MEISPSCRRFHDVLERTIPFAYFRKVRSRELLISNHPFSHIHLPYSLHEIPLLACVWESDSYFDKSPVRMASDEGAIRSSGWNGIAMVISNAVDEEYASAFVGDLEGYANSARAKIAGHYIMSKGIANENPRLVIVLMDADMLVTGSPRDILEEVSQFSSKLISNAITTVVLSQYFLSTCLQFYKFDADLVFATDHPYLTYTWPEDPSETGKQIDAFFSSIAPSDISPKFVNGGLVVGYAEAVHSMLAAILEDDGKLLRSLDPKKKRDDTDDVSMMDMDQRAFANYYYLYHQRKPLFGSQHVAMDYLKLFQFGLQGHGPFESYRCYNKTEPLSIQANDICENDLARIGFFPHGLGASKGYTFPYFCMSLGYGTPEESLHVLKYQEGSDLSRDCNTLIYHDFINDTSDEVMEESVSSRTFSNDDDLLPGIFGSVVENFDHVVYANIPYYTKQNPLVVLSVVTNRRVYTTESYVTDPGFFETSELLLRTAAWNKVALAMINDTNKEGDVYTFQKAVHLLPDNYVLILIWKPAKATIIGNHEDILGKVSRA